MEKSNLKTVLLVDDDDATNFIHRCVIESTGFVENVVVVEDGREAIEYLQKNKEQNEALPNIIFLDLNMPLMDGWEVIDKLKELNITQKDGTFVCILTTSENPEDLEKAKNIELVDEYLTKLLDKDKFTNIVFEHWKE